MFNQYIHVHMYIYIHIIHIVLIAYSPRQKIAQASHSYTTPINWKFRPPEIS